MIRMRAQQKWLFDHAVYLFLGGLGGASYFVGALAGFLGGEWEAVARTGVGIAVPAVAAGLLFLFFGLGSPMKAVYAWRCPGTSWISRGVLFLTAFVTVAAIHAGLWVWPFRSLAEAYGTRELLAVIGMVLSFAVMVYTGFLLGASRPIAFWSTGMLPLLFLVSALASGAFAILAALIVQGEAVGAAIVTLERAAIVLVITEALALVFQMQATHRVPEGQAAARLLTKEAGAVLFWLGVVAVGIVLPLVLLLLDASRAGGAGAGGSRALVIAAALSGLAGNLFLRQAVLRGGVFARLKAGSFEYVVTNP